MTGKIKPAAAALRSDLLLLLQGALTGAGAILPGISGGLLCAAFGIYEPMMELLSHPRRAFKKHYRLFLPFLAGWAAGFVLLAGVMETVFRPLLQCSPHALCGPDLRDASRPSGKDRGRGEKGPLDPLCDRGGLRLPLFQGPVRGRSHVH